MKRLLRFFMGLLLVAISIAALVVTAAVYETGNKGTVETYFFQPNDLSFHRPGDLFNVADLTEDQIRNMLLNKYITEYFYVTPDIDELERRKSGRSAIARMSTAKVFDKWMESVVPNLEEMAQKNMMQTATLLSVKPQAGSNQYWQVDYELKTWSQPNDLSANPTVTHGTMYMNIFFAPGVREQFQNQADVTKYLEAQGDPAALFRFGILDITTQEE